MATALHRDFLYRVLDHVPEAFSEEGPNSDWGLCARRWGDIYRCRESPSVDNHLLSFPSNSDEPRAREDRARMEHPSAPRPKDSELVTPLEVLSAIQARRIDAAPGLDGILVICLKKCCGILLPWLRQIFSNPLVVGYFPEKWCIAKVLALRKPGKASYATPWSYRPMGLLSNMSKLVETIVNRWLMRYVESRCLLYPEQFGFRAGREVLGACRSLVEDLTAAFC